MKIIKACLFLFGLSFSELSSGELMACISRQPNQSSKEAVEKFEQSQGLKVREKEILIRLVLAESLNTNYFLDPKCVDQGPLITKGIAWGAMNRVRLGRREWDSVRKTVFAANQFAPAVSNLSIFADLFTCPTLVEQSENQMNELMHEQKKRFEAFAKKTKRADLYEKYIPLTLQFAKSAADEAFEGNPEKNPFTAAKVQWPVINFYYPLSDDVKYGNPDWNRCNQPLDNIEIDGKRLDPYCIRFFHSEQVRRTRCTASGEAKLFKKKKARKPGPKVNQDRNKPYFFSALLTYTQ